MTDVLHTENVQILSVQEGVGGGPPPKTDESEPEASSSVGAPKLTPIL